jgi:DNA-binding response OmpR family regulator
MRTETMKKNRSPREVGDTDDYNELQVSRNARARHGPLGAAPPGTAERRLRVLVVDDHRASAETISMLVRAWGHDVRKAYAGAAGLALAVDYRPDVLLLDVMMPELSGPALALRVRQEARLQNCLLIAVTGCTDERQRLHCLEAGVDLYLVKPVGPHTLQSLLMAESKRLQRTRRAATTLALSVTTEQQWTGVKSYGPARLGRNIAATAAAI